MQTPSIVTKTRDNKQQLVECELAREIKVFGDNPPQYYFVHRKSHMN
jgi:hypothetical protein